MMCGVFGFVAGEGQRPSLEVLKRVAAVTMRRGPHAWGMAWIDGRGRLKMYKQAGRMVDHLNLLSMAADARLLIGHFRWATMGDPDNNLNNHPHPVDGGWIVHNGQVRNYAQLVEAFDLYPVSECDSEVLGLLVEQGTGSVLDRCRAAALIASAGEDDGTLFAARQPLVLLGLWSRPGRLVAVRRGNPLHCGQAAEGHYLASLPDSLPGAVRAVKDDTAWLFTRKEVRHAAL